MKKVFSKNLEGSHVRTGWRVCGSVYTTCGSVYTTLCPLHTCAQMQSYILGCSWTSVQTWPEMRRCQLLVWFYPNLNGYILVALLSLVEDLLFVVLILHLFSFFKQFSYRLSSQHTCCIDWAGEAQVWLITLKTTAFHWCKLPPGSLCIPAR